MWSRGPGRFRLINSRFNGNFWGSEHVVWRVCVPFWGCRNRWDPVCVCGSERWRRGRPSSCYTESRCVERDDEEDRERNLASDHPTERFIMRSIWHVPVPPTGGDVSSQLQQLISGIVDIPGQHLSSCIHIHLTCSTIYIHTKCFHHNLVSVLREGSSSEVSSISFLYKCFFLRTDCHMSNRSSFGDWRFGDL